MNYYGFADVELLVAQAEYKEMMAVVRLHAGADYAAAVADTLDEWQINRVKEISGDVTSSEFNGSVNQAGVEHWIDEAMSSPNWADPRQKKSTFNHQLI